MNKLVEYAKSHPANHPFFAFIVDKNSGEILCQGVNNHNQLPIYHGEMRAIDDCAKKIPHLDWSQTVLYSTAEPCAMCEGAVIWLGISKVVYGTSIAYLTKQGWPQIQITANEVVKKSPSYHGEVIGGVLAQETDKLFAEHPYKS